MSTVTNGTKRDTATITLLKNEKFKGHMTTDILIVGFMRPVSSKFNPKSIKGVVFGTKEVLLGCINGK